MLTKADKAFLHSEFATKAYLDTKLKNYVTHDYLDLSFRMFKQWAEDTFVSKEEFRETMNRVFQNFDVIVGEIRAMREELAALSYRQQEHTFQLENHESRLITIESGLVVH